MVGAGDLTGFQVAFFNLIFPDGRGGYTGRMPRHSDRETDRDISICSNIQKDCQHLVHQDGHL
jgi:hypothetical protein